MRMHWQVRFIVPGSMVCNLDFVESIFGNGNARGTAHKLVVGLCLCRLCARCARRRCECPRPRLFNLPPAAPAHEPPVIMHMR